MSGTIPEGASRSGCAFCFDPERIYLPAADRKAKNPAGTGMHHGCNTSMFRMLQTIAEKAGMREAFVLLVRFYRVNPIREVIL